MARMSKYLIEFICEFHGAFVLRERRKMPEIAGDAAKLIDPKNIDISFSDKKNMNSDIRNVYGDINIAITDYKFNNIDGKK